MDLVALHVCVCVLLQLPWQVAPRLYLGSAVIADSHHLLAHLGVTHIVNATEVGSRGGRAERRGGRRYLVSDVATAVIGLSTLL
jgi:hypothetical protein